MKEMKMMSEESDLRGSRDSALLGGYKINHDAVMVAVAVIFHNGGKR